MKRKELLGKIESGEINGKIYRSIYQIAMKMNLKNVEGMKEDLFQESILFLLQAQKEKKKATEKQLLKALRYFLLHYIRYIFETDIKERVDAIDIINTHRHYNTVETADIRLRIHELARRAKSLSREAEMYLKLRLNDISYREIYNHSRKFNIKRVQVAECRKALQV